MSEIRVNTIVNAESTAAPNLPYGIQIPTGMGITGAGGVNITGVVTATSFSGDGSSLSGIGETVNVRTETITVSGVSTFTGVSNFSAAVNADATTDSTSTTTGALIVDGGVGIAKNVYIGAGLSVAGTLTYEDVTNVDSVGMVTAKSGLNVSGGEVAVGSALTISGVGVATFIGAAGVAVTITPSTGKVQATTFEGPLTGNVTGDLTGTVNTAAQTSITSVGTLAGLTVGSAGEFKVGTALTIGTAGLTTFAGDVDFSGVTASMVWDRSDDALEFADNVEANWGSSTDLRIYHSSSNASSYIQNSQGNLFIEAPNSSAVSLRKNGTAETMLVATAGGSVEAYYDNSAKLATTNEGIKVTGFTSTTAGMGVTGGLFEGAWIKAGKLTDNLQIGIATANVFYFTTQETTTGTPNIRWDDTYSLSSKMAVGDVASVTVIATAAAGGYCANWTIDGNAVTEEWVGGSAPSAGGSDGLDIYSFTIIKTGTGTGDSGFKVIANVSNAT